VAKRQNAAETAALTQGSSNRPRGSLVNPAQGCGQILNNS